MAIDCPSCGGAAPDGARFCPHCGATMAAACAACGAPLVAGARFCAQCGTQVGSTTTADGTSGGTPTAPPPDPAGTTSERKIVSVLFADLVGFTSLAEGRDAEAVRDLLSTYFERCQEVITRYGGTVEKFIGDAVMAVWGAPIAHENDAERAVRAALDLLEEVRTLGPGLQARAGVLTGEAAVTIGATNQGLVAGDIVNTASRLQSVAQPGTVLVGESTEQAANSAVSFEPAGEQELKGKVAPVPAFRAVRVIAERGGRGRSDGLEAPFIGRDDEYRLLRDLVHATTRDKRPRLVSIMGVAGVGKSRMAWELSKYLDGVVESIYWHGGRSPAYGEGITFWALGEMVRSRLGLVEGDDEAATRAAVAKGVETWLRDEQERRWVERALLALLGAESPTGVEREELFSAWRTFFERIAEQGTVVLVFEDLHWADAGLLDFIDHLLDWSTGKPIIVVTLARPELLERRPEWGAGRRTFVGVALEPLAQDRIGEILEALAPGIPPDGVAAIVERADGIPLYAVETVRMLVAEGRLVAEDGRYRPAGDLSELAVPATLQALIAARLDALDPADRSFICDAAVLGQSFTDAGLAAVSGLEPEPLQARLRSLVRRELLVAQGDPRSPERGQYSFVQALVREVAYGTLSRRDRRTRHLAAARFFENLGEEELAGALASHYLAAYRVSVDEPEEAQALAAQARVSLRGAAERAAALGSHDQATAYFLEAIEVTTDPSDRADLLERAGVTADRGGRFEAAQANLGAAADRWRDLGDRRRVARSIGLLGHAMLQASHPEEGVELLEAAARDFADLGDDPSLAFLEHQLARALWFVEDRPRAIAVADQALGRAERLEDLPTIADALITKGAIIAVDGRPHEGFGALEAGVALAEREGLNGIRARGLLNMAGTLIGRDPRRALEVAREAMTLASRIGFRSSLAIAAGNAVEVAAALGELDWAIATADEILEMDLEPSDRQGVLRGAAEARLLRGDPSDDLMREFRGLVDPSQTQNWSNYVAAEAMREFLAGRYPGAVERWEVSARDNPLNSPSDLPRAARAALWGGDEATVRRIVETFTTRWRQGRASEHRLRIMLAGLAALDDQREEAVARYESGMAGLREFGLEPEVVLAVLDMIVVLGDRDPAVLRTIDDARATIERLGLVALDRALERLLAAGGSGTSPGQPAADDAAEERVSGTRSAG